MDTTVCVKNAAIKRNKSMGISKKTTTNSFIIQIKRRFDYGNCWK